MTDEDKKILDELEGPFSKAFEEAKATMTFFCIPRENTHEIGCPHKSWTIEQLHSALVTAKASHAAYIQVYGTHNQKESL